MVSLLLKDPQKIDNVNIHVEGNIFSRYNFRKKFPYNITIYNITDKL